MHLPVVLIETTWLPHDHYGLKVSAEFPLPPVGELAIALVEGRSTGTLIVQERTESLPLVGEVAKMLTLGRVAVVERDEVDGRPYARGTLLTAPDDLDDDDLGDLRLKLKAASRRVSSHGRRRDWFELLRTRDPEMLLDHLGAETERAQEFLEAVALSERLTLALEWMDSLLQVPDEPQAELEAGPAAETVHALEDRVLFEGAMQDCGPMAGAARCRPNPCLVGDVLVLSVLRPGAVFGFSPNGDVLWQRDLDVWDAPCPLGPRVLVCTGDALHCLEAATGEPVWAFQPCGEDEGHWLYGSPYVHEERIYLGDRQGRLHCLNAENGEQVWSATLSPGEDVNSTPIVCDGLVLAASNSGVLAALQAATGKPVWKATLDGPCADTLRIYDERVLMSTGRSLYLYHPTRGRVAQRWHWPRTRISSHCVFPDRILLVRQGAEHTQLVGLRGRDEDFEGPASMLITGVASEPALGLAYELRTDALLLVDPTTGARLHGFAPARSLARADTPLLCDDTLYVWTGEGTLWALDVADLLPARDSGTVPEEDPDPIPEEDPDT